MAQTAREVRNRFRQLKSNVCRVELQPTALHVDTFEVIAKHYLDRVHLRNVRSASRNTTEEVIGVGRRTSQELDDIDERIDRLSLLCEAMWGLIQDHTDLVDDDLHERVRELDESDGRQNFRRQRVAQPCECGAKVSPTLLRCQFCGAPAALSSLFDVV